ncbi:MAG TPA: hypothetical protein VL359_18435, partial [bacterium]|nr:hypothetical protein [bacterium]
AFPGPPVVLHNDGPAVAQVVQVARRGGAHADLLVARTDVSLGALLQALSNRQVHLDAALYPFSAAGLQEQPVYRSQLTFRHFQEGTPVLLLAADLAGTGQRQVLMNLEPGVLSVLPNGPAGPDLRAAPRWQVQVPLPRVPEEAFVGSWSGDEREQVAFWYRGSHTPAELRRTLRWVLLAP